MAVKKLYLDKRTLKTPTIGGSEANLQNVLDLQDYIGQVSPAYTLPNTVELDTINEFTSAHGVIVDGTLIKDSQVFTATGSNTNPSYSFASDTDTGLYRVSSNRLGFAAGGTKIVEISTTGVAVTGDIIVSNGVSNAGATIFAGFYPIAAEQALSTSGTPAAVNVTSYHTKLTSTGTGDAVTLAVGSVPGQMKKVTYVAEGAGGDTVILTPSVTTGFATATFNAVGDFVVFIFNGTYWSVIENSGATIA
jgi:hypothetical protein